MLNLKSMVCAVLCLCFLSIPATAKPQTFLQSFQTLIEKALNQSAIQIAPLNTPDADRARYSLVIALAKNGSYPSARQLAQKLDSTPYAASAWAQIGRRQSLISAEASREDFKRALQAVQRLKSTAYAQQAAALEIAEAQAFGGQVNTALQTVQNLENASWQEKALLRVAQIAAQQGNASPATRLLEHSSQPQQRSKALSLQALALSQTPQHRAQAQERLKDITQPLDTVPVLLSLFDHATPQEDGTVWLDEAVKQVTMVRSGLESLGFTDLKKDVLYAAIALRYTRSPYAPQTARQKAVSTLNRLSNPDNAPISYFRQICKNMALSDLALSLSVARRVSPSAQVSALSAVAEGLAENLATLSEDQRFKRLKTIEGVINEALDIANTLSDSDKRWAGIPVVYALAHAEEYQVAQGVANRLDPANVKAYAMAGIARAAIEHQQATPFHTAFKNMQDTALTEKEPETQALILAQTTLAMLEPLLHDEAIEAGSVLAGLQ